MSPSRLRTLLLAYLVLLVPVGWLATTYERFQVDGDAVAYMDLADLIHAHRWAGVVNGYWHPLYPAFLAAAQVLLHPSRQAELGAYYVVNYIIFLAQIAAMWAFTTALNRVRVRSLPPHVVSAVSRDGLRLIGLALVVIASQRELSMGKIRPDALLQAVLLAAFAALLNALTSERLIFPALLGLCFGLAYLTKSFAFVMAFASVLVMVLVLIFWERRPWRQAALAGAVGLGVFALIAGPYVAALSHQKGRFDFGDSGALNYAWYAGGVEKMHLEPWMNSSFGHAQVALKHPEAQLLASPGVYSYRAEPYGTYPDWFDTTFFNDRITPHLDAPVLLRRDARNVVLIFRYLLNHPEGWLLLGLLIGCGGRWRFRTPNQGTLWQAAFWRRDGLLLVPVALGLVMWALYALVNVEERYVTLAYLVVLLPCFAALRLPASTDGERTAGLQGATSAMVALLAIVALGQSLRLALEERRTGMELTHAWQSARMAGAADGLARLGVQPGDEVACMGTVACLNEEYWARLAGVRILTEVYNPTPAHLLEQWNGLRNRDHVLSILESQGAKVLVASFDPGTVNEHSASELGTAWVRLGATDFYALPLELAPPERLAKVAFGAKNELSKGQGTPAALPWETHREGGP